MKRLLLAIIIAATAAPTLAEPIDATTPCSVAIQAFGSPKRAGEVLAGAPSQEVLEIGNYILNIMDQLDHEWGLMRPFMPLLFWLPLIYITAFFEIAAWPTKKHRMGSDSTYTNERVSPERLAYFTMPSWMWTSRTLR